MLIDPRLVDIAPQLQTSEMPFLFVIASKTFRSFGALKFLRYGSINIASLRDRKKGLAKKSA